MTLLWIPFTLFAAFMQSWRNALQKQLRGHTSTLGVTLARFILALPLAAIYLCGLYGFYPSAPIPSFGLAFFGCVLVAALAQIAATAFMVVLFKTRNYAIGVGLAKSEAVIAAALGALFFAAPLTPLAWLGVLVGALAVWFMSLQGQPASQNQPQGLSAQTMVTGLASGLCFALCTLYIREAALVLRHDFALGFLVSAAWVLFFVILFQTVLLTSYLAWREPQTLRDLLAYKRLTASISLFGFFGSVGWFTAMSLQTVALVKTLGQVEVLFTLLISALWFKERLGRADYLGLALIVLGAALVVVA